MGEKGPDCVTICPEDAEAFDSKQDRNNVSQICLDETSIRNYEGTHGR